MTTAEKYDKNVNSIRETKSKGAAGEVSFCVIKAFIVMARSFIVSEDTKNILQKSYCRWAYVKKGEEMMNQELLKLAKEMVQIPSINGTDGERKIGEYIEAYIKKIPYFQKHPSQLIVQELKGDSLRRMNVFAVLLGESPDNHGKTILLHGHTDTVGLEGYGAAEDYACMPDELQEALQSMLLPEEVRADLESGEYMFGRGACDMKSGDAVFLGLLREFSEKPQELAGNLVFSFNPVEENLHQGIIEGLDVLEKLKEEYRLQYILAVNNDYICPLYPGDTVKTIYTGVVGKLLPCFYIRGKETHVGQCFEGLDASRLAAELVRKIHLNCDFSDTFEGETSCPPSVLKLKDLKPWYNVQTALEAFVYFNYFVHNSSMEEITNKLKEAAKEASREVLREMEAENKRFCGAGGYEASGVRCQCRVMTYEELYRIAGEEDGATEMRMREILQVEMEKGTDKREIPIEMIRYLLQKAGIMEPVIVLYYGAPYCPHNTLQGGDEKLIEELGAIAEETAKETGDTYRLMKFFPSLSDSSYLKIDDSEKSIDALIHNFPGFEALYPVPIGHIRRLNITEVNFGNYS